MLRELAKLHAGGTMILAKREENGAVTPLGSAFLCHNKGYILTCAHTFSLADSLAALLVPQTDEFAPITLERANSLALTVAQYDASNDVALLKVTQEGTAFSVPQGVLDASAVNVGALCAHIGFPFADRGLHVRHLSSAFVSAKVISKSGTRQFQFDGTAHDGGSGGPFIDARTGKVIGIVSGRFAPSGGVGGISVGGYMLGNDSCISFATSIQYGIDLMKAEGLDV